MIASVEGARAALPLLAFAVSALWERRDREKKLLTRAAYEDIGGVAGALAQHAEATMDRIGPERQSLVREILRNLVTAQGTRAVIDREELLSAFLDRSAAEDVLRQLIDARLLTSYEVEGAEGEPSHHRVEIAHESLLKAWPRLVRWQAQDEEGALLRDQLKQAAHLWDEKGRTADLLWTGTAYQEYELWRERYPGALTALEEDFARSMAEKARWKKRLVRLTAAVAFVAISAVAVAIGVSRQQAVHGARLAAASKLTALGRTELDRYPTAALAYARKSLETADTVEARRFAVEALWRGPTARVFPETSQGAFVRAAFSPDGRRLALGGFGESVVVVSEDGSVLHRLQGHPAVAEPRGAVFDPTGEHVLTYAAKDPRIRSFDSAGRLAATIPVEAQWVRFEKSGRLLAYGASASGPQERVLTVVEPGSKEPQPLARWKPDWFIGSDHPGTRAPTSIDVPLRWLAYGRDRRVFLHPLTEETSRLDIELGRHSVNVQEVLFYRDGERLFSADVSGEIREWSVSGRSLIRSIRAPSVHRYSVLSLDRDGSRIAWASGSQRAACVWELDGPAALALRCLRQGDWTEAGEAVFHPQGIWLATTTYNGLALWPLKLPDSRVIMVHSGGAVMDLAFSPDSGMLASGARDGLFLVPLKSKDEPVRKVELGAEYFAYGVAWAPSGRELALAAPLLGVYTVPIGSGTPRKILEYPSENVALGKIAFDSAGRTVAVVSHYAPKASDQHLYVIDRESGSVRSWPLGASLIGGGYAGQARAVGFAYDGRLVTGGDGGIRRWDLSSGASETIAGGPGTFATFAMSANARRLVCNFGKRWNGSEILESEVRVLDLDTGAQRAVRAHGDRLTLAVATDPAGEIIVTGDAAGVVRVGSVNGGEPHLLIGHSGPIFRVEVSPDRRWIASSSGAEVRLWPMPDLSKPPFHTLPYDELTRKLKSLTNLEVIEDPLSATGYRVAIGPCPGWKDVPTW